jgi:hypothetical protein
MKVTFEKNEIIFIQKCFEKTVNKIILICRNYFFRWQMYLALLLIKFFRQN